MGVDTSPVPGVGPSIHYTITAEDGTTTTDVKALTPSKDSNGDELTGTDSQNRNQCSLEECEWTYEFDSLTRGDNVQYYMSAQDLYPPAPNTVSVTTYDFDVANPTMSLVVEWHEWKEDSNTPAIRA